MTEVTKSLKDFSAVATKKVKFNGSDVMIQKLTTRQVREVQEKAKAVEKVKAEQAKAAAVAEKAAKDAGQEYVADVPDDEDENLNTMQEIIRMGCPLAKDLTADDFLDFAIDDVAKLAEEIMVYSGIGGKSGK